MSETIFTFDGSDPEMAKACRAARSTFKYFWRELYWERRRIVPGLDMAMLKLAFCDGKTEVREDGNPNVEHMWVDDIGFDGIEVSGTLINSPSWIKSVQEGDFVKAPFERVGDWMYAIDGVAYGAYTVNQMRSQMGTKDREAHDSAWGLSFGDPSHIKISPEKVGKKPGLLRGLFKKKTAVSPTNPELEDHPMCLNMLEKIEEQIKSDPSLLDNIDENGWTILHHEALAGNLAIVKLLLMQGCDPNTLTKNGQKASDLAAALDWTRISEVLK